MTKRFILTEQFVTLQGVTFVKDDNADVDTYYTVDGAVDLLNEQHETIQRLNENITELLSVDIEKELLEENEQLKSSDTITDLETEIMNLKTIIQQLTNDNTKQKKKLNTTMKENEQLKIALKDKENLISICEKKFKELGYLITCDDDGYVIE